MAKKVFDCAFIAVLLLSILGHCEMSIYPGLRRKPMQNALQQQYELPTDFLAQLMEENARRRLQQQFEQQLELINMQLVRQRQLLERERYRQRQEELQALAETEDDYTNNLNNQQYDQYDNVDHDDVNDMDSEGIEFGYNRNAMIGNENVNSNSNINNNNNNYNYNNDELSRFANIAYTTSDIASSNNLNRNNYNNINAGVGNKNPNFLRERIPFAVGPSDVRFFDTDDINSNSYNNNNNNNRNNNEPDNENEQSAELDTQTLDDYVEYNPERDSKPEKFLTIQQQQQQQLQQKQQKQQQELLKQQQEHQPNQLQQEQHQPQSLAEVLTKTPTPALRPAGVLSPSAMDSSKLLDGGAANFYRIKPQTAAAAAVAGVHIATPAPTSGTTQHEISALIEKLQKETKSNLLLNAGNKMVIGGQETDQIVLRQRLGMDSEMGVYIVALIAGISAACTVGLLALSISWLHSRTKAAADVEYPAYGITGPNREVSPSGDRKLAHSAQMYHYQHQKQQIIAMENRQCAEGTCGLSDVESDDDNEEGDYTVYECPGLAPTGEMEVKNPLFLDETPATPANQAAAAAAAAAVTNNITQAQPQQPTTVKKGSVRTLTNLLSSATSSGGAKPKRKNNN